MQLYVFEKIEIMLLQLDCCQGNTTMCYLHYVAFFYHSNPLNHCFLLICLYSQVLGLQVASSCHRERGPMVNLSTSMCDFHAFYSFSIKISAVLNFCLQYFFGWYFSVTSLCLEICWCSLVFLLQTISLCYCIIGSCCVDSILLANVNWCCDV